MLALLLSHMVNHKCLRKCDVNTINMLINQLLLDERCEDLNEVNHRLIEQVKLEALTVYLLGIYGALAKSKERDVDETEAKELMIIALSHELRKYTVGEKQAILTSDPGIQILRRELDDAQSLLKDISNLSRVVFGRSAKLDQLSNNYRRELTTDSKAD